MRWRGVRWLTVAGPATVLAACLGAERSRPAATSPAETDQPTQLSPAGADLAHELRAGWQRIALEPTSPGDPSTGRAAQTKAGSIAASQDRTVVVGDLPVGCCGNLVHAWVSDDGRHWAQVADANAILGPPANRGFSSQADVVGLGHGFVAVGTAPRSLAQPDVGVPAAWFSPDGRRWRRAVVEAAGVEGGSMTSVRRGEDLLAFGHRGRGRSRRAAAWRSRDGRRWTAVDLPPPLRVAYQVEWVEVGRVRVAWGQVPATEADHEPALWLGGRGRRWERLAEAAAPDNVVQVLAHAGGLLAVGSRMVDAPTGGQTTVHVLYASGDGRRWREVATLAGQAVVHETPHGLIAVGAQIAGEPGLWASSDGQAWARVELPADSFAATAYGPVVLSDLATTPDGRVLVAGGRALRPGNKPRWQPTVWVWSPAGERR